MFVSGGGCSGFQYGFTFEEDAQEDDWSFDFDGITLLIDPMSSQYLQGAEVDYTESLQGSQFSIKNPNAQTTCGCGSSFSAQESIMPSPRRVSQIVKGKKSPKPKTVNAMAKRVVRKKK